MTRVHHVKAAKDYPSIGVKKGETYYWWKHFRGAKQMSKEAPSRSQTAGSGRAARFEVWQSDVSNTKTALEEIRDAVQEWLDADESERCAPADLVIPTPEAAAGFDVSGLEELKDEMESWRDNMSSANMEHLPKYDEVDSCCSELEEILSTAEGIGIPEAPAERTAESLEQYVGELDDAIGELEELESASVDFPGMY